VRQTGTGLYPITSLSVERASFSTVSVKNGGYLGQCLCLPGGQLDPDERTGDDAGAIQNLVVCRGGVAAQLGCDRTSLHAFRARVPATSPTTVTIWPRSGLQICALGRDWLGPHVSLRWRRQMPDASLEHYSFLPFNPIHPRWATLRLIRSRTVPLCSVHGADQLQRRSSEKMLGRIEHELIYNMRIWQSYNPPLSNQQTEIALERHYVSN
jgi:hypothetical protein